MDESHFILQDLSDKCTLLISSLNFHLQALYENLLVELPLAEFFLGKLCSSRDPDVHALASLDPALYRGLLMLKSHGRDEVPDLGLDFTIVSDELGEQRVSEL